MTRREMPETVVAAVVQMQIDFLDPVANLRRAVDGVTLAAGRGADLVVLPELSNIGYPESTDETAKRSYYEATESLNGTFVSTLARLARSLDVHVVAGFARRHDDVAGVMSNEVVLLSPDGQVRTGRKTHLPRIERRYFAPGAELAVHDTAVGRLGLLVCADNSFPEAARVMALAGVDIVCVSYMAPRLANPSLYPAISVTRAYENQCYVVTAQRTGSQGDQEFSGTSCIAGPDGALLAELGTDEGVAVATLERESMLETRLWQPRFHDRRPELYGPLATPLD